MTAFIIADENNSIVEESNILLNTNQNNFVARTSVSCSGCNAQGFLPMVDEVRKIMVGNALNFDADTLQAVQDVYPSPKRFAEIVQLDSDFYQDALRRIGIPLKIADSMSGVFIQFDSDMELKHVPGDLGIAANLLNDNLALLDPSLLSIRNSPLKISAANSTASPASTKAAVWPSPKTNAAGTH